MSLRTCACQEIARKKLVLLSSMTPISLLSQIEKKREREREVAHAKEKKERKGSY